MKYLFLLITFLSVILAVFCSTSCDQIAAQVEKTEPPKVEQPETPVEPAGAPDEPPSIELSFKKDIEEMRFAQVLILIQQVCTVDGAINKECRNAVSKCFGDRWQPTPKILKCFDEWEAKP